MRKRRPERENLYRSAAYLDLQRALANNVVRIRRQRSWTQEETATACGISTRLLQRVENSAANATLITIARLCTGLGVRPAELFTPLPTTDVPDYDVPRR